MKADGSKPRGQGRERRDRSPRAASIRTTPRGWSRRRRRRWRPGTYHVEWTTISPTTATLARGTWTFTVAVAADALPDSRPDRDTVGRAQRDRRRNGGPDPTPLPATPAPTAAPTPAPSADGSATRERQRRRPADHRRPDRRSGPARPTCSADAAARPTRHDPRPDAARLAARVGGARSARWSGSPSSCRRRSPPTRSTRPTRAACRWPSTSSGPRLTVALSFVFVIVRDVRAAPPDLTAGGHLPPALAPLSRSARIGLVGWAWIIAQGIAGGSSDGDVATLFLWVYGWVGLAIVCAVIGPAWHFLDPFSTLHDLGAALLRRARRRRAGRSPTTRRASVAGRRRSGSRSSSGSSSSCMAGPSTLFIVLVGYTALTLAMMAQFGRDEWRVAGRDVHGLVPACSAGSRTGARRRGRARRDPRRSGAACSSPAGRPPT